MKERNVEKELSRANEFRELLVWQKAHRLVLNIYHFTRTFPPSEQFIITDQLRRAAISIPTNIAEGMGRASKGDLRRFLVIARGSSEEVKYLLLLSFDLGYLSEINYKALNERVVEIGKMLNGFIQKLKP